jgi:hypothetical protein
MKELEEVSFDLAGLGQVIFANQRTSTWTSTSATISIHLENSNLDNISYASSIYCILNIGMNYTSIVDDAFSSSKFTRLEKRFVTSHRSFLSLWESFKRTYLFVNNFLVTVMISNGDLRSQSFTESSYTITSYYPILFVWVNCVLPAF